MVAQIHSNVTLMIYSYYLVAQQSIMLNHFNDYLSHCTARHNSVVCAEHIIEFEYGVNRNPQLP